MNRWVPLAILVLAGCSQPKSREFRYVASPTFQRIYEAPSLKPPIYENERFRKIKFIEVGPKANSFPTLNTKDGPEKTTLYNGGKIGFEDGTEVRADSLAITTRGLNEIVKVKSS